MRRLWAAALLAVTLLACFPAGAGATVDYAEQTGRPCTYCHRGPGGPLTEEGEAFRAAGYRIPGTDLGQDGETGGQPGTDLDSAPILSLAGWARALLLWLHLVGMTAWLGAIIFVHIVQTPRVAGRGIPRGYFVLAWPSIFLLGISGVLLTLSDIQSLSNLVETRWGVLLLVKVALFLILMAVAVLVTLVIGPRLRRMAQTSRPHPLAEHVHYAQEGRITVGYEGRIYDVSSSRMWQEGRHIGRHAAWQDLTAAMGAAPHGTEVFREFSVLAGGPTWTPRPLRVFLILAYGNLALVLAALLVVAIWLAA